MDDPISSPSQSFGASVSRPPTHDWLHWTGSVLREAVTTIVPAVVIALLIHVFLAQATRVYGQSMEPNLHEDQRLVIEKVSYHLHGPRRGDVVVLRDPNGSSELLIKRVVGLPGEQITVGNGRVLVDGKPIPESYLTQATLGPAHSWTVPPLQVFVLGDNRGASRDSRSFGPVSINSLVGHAVFRYWPLSRFGAIQ